MGEALAGHSLSKKPANDRLKFWSSFCSDHPNVSRLPYLPHLQCALVCVLISLLFRFGTFKALCAQSQLVVFALCTVSVAVMTASIYFRWMPSPCYLVDFCCMKGEDYCTVGLESYEFFARRWRAVDLDSFVFQFKVLLRSGIGEEACAPSRLLEKGEDIDMQDAREETQRLITGATTLLFRKTGVDAKEIDIVVLNSSLFNPSPSLTAFLVNRFKMRSNVKSYNLAGMGCSAGLISIDLAKDLLRVHRNSYALVVSTENITQNMYFGRDRSMMVSNCLFRCGASAILLSNKSKDMCRAKFKLMHCVRVHRGADQNSFDCITQKEDEKGLVGISLQVSLTEVAAQTLRENIVRLAPRILPFSELLKVVFNITLRKIFNKKLKPYDPNFKRAINHFCIHPGGRAVIDSIGKGLKLSAYDAEPGRMALHRFGNTSSSGIWYALAYCEAKNRLKKGDKVWQIALGSGFKCNSAVWKVLHDIDAGDGQVCNPWNDCVHRYPEGANNLSGSYLVALLARMLHDGGLNRHEAKAKAEKELGRILEIVARGSRKA